MLADERREHIKGLNLRLRTCRTSVSTVFINRIFKLFESGMKFCCRNILVSFESELIATVVSNSTFCIYSPMGVKFVTHEKRIV